jgi:hypothetical protein
LNKQHDLLSGQVWRGSEHQRFGHVLPTGYPVLDQLLPGGWPQGAITEIHVADYGIGELSLLMPALVGLSRSADAGKWIVWVAPPFVPYAPALVRQGLCLDRILLVHPSARRQDGLWAVEQALRCGGSVAVLAWVRHVDRTVLRRLQLAAEEHRCWAVLFRPAEAGRESSPAAVRLRLSTHDAKTCIQVLKCRGARPGSAELELVQLEDLSADGSDGSRQGCGR